MTDFGYNAKTKNWISKNKSFWKAESNKLKGNRQCMKKRELSTILLLKRIGINLIGTNTIKDTGESEILVFEFFSLYSDLFICLFTVFYSRSKQSTCLNLTFHFEEVFFHTEDQILISNGDKILMKLNLNIHHHVNIRSWDRC